MRKKIENYEGYEVNEQGLVRSINFNKTNRPELLKQNKGYCVIRKGGVTKNIKIGRLVAQAFLGLDINDKTICVLHIDNDKTNNNINNLFLGKHGDGLSLYLNDNKLITHKKKRTSETYSLQTKEIIELRQSGLTLKQISEEVGLCSSYISMITNNKRRVYETEYTQ